ncbi:unnamed protein product [Amaranthus hypochondriacus]
MAKISFISYILVLLVLVLFTKSGANFGEEEKIKMRIEEDGSLVEEMVEFEGLKQCVPCGGECSAWSFGCCGDCDCQFNKCVFT